MPDREDGHEEHAYGAVPQSRRPLMVIALTIAGGSVIVAGLLMNWLDESPVRWPALVIIAGSLVMLLAFYLWIRLSD